MCFKLWYLVRCNRDSRSLEFPVVQCSRRYVSCHPTTNVEPSSGSPLNPRVTTQTPRHIPVASLPFICLWRSRISSLSFRNLSSTLLSSGRGASMCTSPLRLLISPYRHFTAQADGILLPSAPPGPQAFQAAASQHGCDFQGQSAPAPANDQAFSPYRGRVEPGSGTPEVDSAAGSPDSTGVDFAAAMPGADCPQDHDQAAGPAWSRSRG